jgi:hypothetical protein
MKTLARHCGLLLACGALACRSTVNSTPSTTAVPATTPTTPTGRAPQRVTLSDDWSSTVTVIREDSIILSLADGSKRLERRQRTARFRMFLSPGIAIAVQLDSLAFNPAIPIQSGSLGTVWNGRVDARGRLSTLSLNRHNTTTDELEQTIRELLPRVPRGGIFSGMTWRDTSDGSLRIDGYETDEERLASWSVGERTNRGALILVPVIVEEKFEQLGKGVVLQRPSDMTAQGTRRGTWFMTMVGQLSQAVLVDSVAKLVTITGSRDPVPTMEFTRTTIQYSPIRP